MDFVTTAILNSVEISGFRFTPQISIVASTIGIAEGELGLMGSTSYFQIEFALN